MLTPSIILIVFIACLSQATLGFGLGLLAMPMLTLVTDVQTAVALVGFVGNTVGLFILAEDWREVDLTASWRLIVAAWPAFRSVSAFSFLPHRPRLPGRWPF